ncbi:MAG: iron-sulfur cluster carrier protein ApbC [Gammaproteobacteria bacterium]
MSDVLKQQINAAIAAYPAPYLETDLISAGAVKAITVTEDQQAHIQIDLGFPHKAIAEQLQAGLQQQLTPIAGLQAIHIDIDSHIVAHTVQQGAKRLLEIKNIIAIASGKGGVGKSTVAVNLALALQAQGATVGLLDADIYGPSQAHMLGVTASPDMRNGKQLLPVMSHGLQTMSIAYLIGSKDTPMVWRGPMVSNALQQLLYETLWQAVDYLIVDLPPGTGDIQLTLAQKIPVSGAVIVTTPQELALLDARKALRMFEKVHISVLGVVENMSHYACPACGHEAHIFAHGGGKRMADQYGIDLLGNIPLAEEVRVQADDGQPIVMAQPDCDMSQSFAKIACKVAAKLSLQAQDYAAKFPNIVVENK